MSHVQKHLDICSCHVTREDMTKLEAVSDQRAGYRYVINCVAYENGVIIFVPFVEEPEQDQEAFLAEVLKAGYSEALVKIFRMAYREQADMIRLDCDGMQVAGLETFNW